jgi:hypothetical protein
MTTATTATLPDPAANRRYRVARRMAAALLLLLLPIVALDATAAPAWARSPNPLEPQTLVKPPGITLEQATNMVRRETGGRVLSASPVDRGGQRGYEVRVLIDGKRVKNVYVDGDGRIRSRD